MKLRLALTILISLLFVTTGCTGFDILNAPICPCNYCGEKNIPYGSLSRQKLDVYRPHDVKLPAPVVIFFYGGEWQAGQKADYRFAGDALTSQGFIAVLPDYRIWPNARFPEFVEDGALAVRWVHDNIARFGGDPNRIYLMGHSAGAHIAALLTLDPHYLEAVGLHRDVIRAMAGLSGPYDFQPYAEDRLIFNMKPSEDKPNDAIEPIHFVDGKAPPMLLLQGGKDEVVPSINATKLADQTTKAGGEVKCIIYPDRGHESLVIALAWPWRWLAPVLKDSTQFFREH
jgi:acetyl esterase/lipase